MSKYSLTDEERRVIINKGTEPPFKGEYDNFFEEGMYVCKQCGNPLYRSSDKFNSHCGWPAFDDEIQGSILRVPDADGERTEIECIKCKGHLGHVFEGEHLTSKNVRHCVNSVSIKFIPIKEEQVIYLCGGCFWGVQYNMMKYGFTKVGFIDGKQPSPSYEYVCLGLDSYIECVKLTYDPKQYSTEAILKHFFEIHDFTDTEGQGVDKGYQYLSHIFYTNEEQKKVSEALIKQLTDKGYKVATKVKPASMFWKAEKYHQNYFINNLMAPTCHVVNKKIFD